MLKIIDNADRGQSLVELAASLFVLLILLSGIVDLGRAIFTKFALQDAAEEGIVFGIGFPTDCNQIVDRIRGNLDNSIFPDSISVDIKIERNDGSFSSCYTTPFNEVFATKKMEIEVATDFKITMPFLGAFTGQSIPLKGTANGIILRPQPPE